MSEKLYLAAVTGYNTFQRGPKKGQPRNLTDRVIRFLIEGLHRVEYVRYSGKYRKFQGSNPDSFLWVGSNGAIRVGKNTSNSFSMTEKYHKLMEQWERANGK